ncbi:ATP-binding protein [Agromyces sp. H66]|uniref:sensor histidine kinase n=1 Tax=Agromyces sp. H66 TaxID=2529859 RepID=UPI001B7D8858|nr:ATP-binding protein [Agromyces sp. H66]
MTLRTRLTLVYGTLFLVAGVGMLAVTWALVQQRFLADGSGPIVQQAGWLEADGRSEVSEGPGWSGTAGPTEDYVIQVVDAARDDALGTFLTQGALAVVLVGGLAVGIGWLVAGRMLHPLATITATARRIADAPDADRRMHERIGLEGPRDEITELANTFDGMLARLDTSFDAQRRFIANASHELRTPLTLNRALLEVSTHRPDASADVRLLGDALLVINARHERLIDGLLLLARSERELPERRFVDLADVVEHVRDGEFADSGIDVQVVVDEAPTAGDPVLLEHLVRNLLENGVRHNIAEGGWVHVETRTDADGRAVLEVSNTGPVVPPYELRSLFEPFHRLDGERMADAPSVGLGLSIVRSIVQAHDGTVELAARPDGGLVVTVVLPGEQYEPGRSGE